MVLKMSAKTAYLFTGQGAQTVGMGRDFYEAEPLAREIFDRADELLGYSVSDICFNGPEERLNSTTVSQPGIFTTSVAMLEVLKSRTAVAAADVTAGLSLGEYTALYAAGVINFEEGLRLVQKRGDAMQAAADSSEGSMVSVMGLDQSQAEDLCKEASEGQLLSCANFNCPGQIVITGEVEACKRAVVLAEKHGAIKAIELKVAGAFHSELMSPAAAVLEDALRDCTIKDPGQVEVIANIDAEYYRSGDQISSGLVKQLTGAILWERSMERLLADGVEDFYEIGPGRVLTGLMRRISRKTKVVNVSSVEALAKLS